MMHGLWAATYHNNILGMRRLCQHNWYVWELRIMLAFWGDNRALLAADCTNLSKDWDTLIEQSVILI